MSEQIEPADAARALDEIDRRREQAVRRPVFPGWSWWAYVALMIVLAAAVDSGRGMFLVIGIALFTIGSAAVDRRVSRAARAAPPYRGLAGPGSTRRTLIALVSFVAVLLGTVVGTALGLSAAGVRYPATIAVAITGVVFAVGGQLLVRYEAAVLLRRSGSRR